MKDVMIDIETLSVHPSNAVVLSVGACWFDIGIDGVGPDGKLLPEPLIGDKFERVLDVRSQLFMGRQVDKSTMEFWAGQQKNNPSAVASILTATPAEVTRAMLDLRAFLQPSTPATAERIWTHGVVFDIGNLTTLFEQATEIALPWKYNAVRDVRTIVYHWPEKRKVTMPTDEPAPAQALIQHSALHDCIAQVTHLWSRWPNG